MSTAPARRPPRTALVHDFLVSVRGADRVFLEICDLWPEADVFTPVYDERGTEGRFSGRNIHTSFLQRLQPSARNFRAFLPLYPAAIESFDLSGYDLVISSSSAWAHAVICDERAVHVSYCHNPFRYAWNERHRTLAERSNPLSRAALSRLFRRWREWDWIAAQRVDRYVDELADHAGAHQGVLRARLPDHLPARRDRALPPAAGREPLPRAVRARLAQADRRGRRGVQQAAASADRHRRRAGRRRLRALAGPTIRFAGRVSDTEAARLLATSQALVVTGPEEFGIAAVEAQAAGRPVIARAAGGLLENVLDGVTGCLWEGGADELAEAVSRFDTRAIDPDACIENARRFDAAVFREAFPREVEAALEHGPSQRQETWPRIPRRPTPSRRPAWRAGRFGAA